MVLSLLLLALVCAGCAGRATHTRIDSTQGSGQPARVTAMLDSFARRGRSAEDRIVERSFIEGSILHMRGMIPEAVARFRNALQYRPRNGALHYAIARAFRSAGHNDSALFHAGMAAQLDSTNVESRLMFAQILIDNSLDGTAINEYEAVLALDPSQHQARCDLARLVLRTDPSRAVVHLEYLRSRIPDDEVVAISLADIYCDRGEGRRAIELIEDLITSSGGELSLYELLGEYVQRVDDPRHALRPVQALIRQHGASDDGDRVLGGIVRRVTARIEARGETTYAEWGRSLLAIVGSHRWRSPDRWVETASLAHALGESAVADAMLENAIAAGCTWDVLRDCLDRYLARGQVDRLTALLDHAERRLRNEPGIPLMLARIEERGERFVAAKRHLQRSLDLIESAEAFEAMARLAYRNGDFAGARGYIQRARALGGHSISLFQTLGDACAAMGDRQNAEAAYREGLEANPWSTELSERLDGLGTDTSGGAGNLDADTRPIESHP